MHDHDICYEILKTNDARFDGQFFVGVTSTGIYCRTTCSAKLPKKENCRFFETAAAAEDAGFRPCLKCRPELAPGTPVFPEMDDIATQAAAVLRDGAKCSVAEFARGLGVSERHLRRMFKEKYGVTPLQYRTTCRLLLAKSLLTDSRLSIAQVASASGFASTRRFEEAFKERYRMSPSRFLKDGKAVKAKTGDANGDRGEGGGIALLLGYRKPYCFDRLLGFLEFRAIEGVESVSDGVYKRTVRIAGCGSNSDGSSGGDSNGGSSEGDSSGGVQAGAIGWVSVHNRPEKSAIELRVSESLCDHLPLIVAKTRRLFDTDCDPMGIEKSLADFHERTGGAYRCPGVRVPCSFDGFEMSVRAILGQQITVKAANTLAGRLAGAFGTPLRDLGVESPYPELVCVFPQPKAFLTQDAADKMGELGIIGQRARSICALARMMDSGELVLRPGADVSVTSEALLSVPGIGPWTAQYILMRALAYPDAFPSADYGIKHAFEGLKPKEIEAMSQAWRPVRSYAVMSIWSTPIDANASTKIKSRKDAK